MAAPSKESTFEDLLRTLAPQVLGVLIRRHGQFAECEDAVQEALLAAAMQWPASGVPENPRSWLLTVASRRLVDYWRSESARQAREQRAAALEPPPREDPSPSSETDGIAEDTLTLLFLCCHPALSAPSQLALTLRAVGGLTTAEIASAFFVPEATMGQRISRAKQSIKKAGAHFELPEPGERKARLGVVLHVLYLIFNEGYAASSGPSMQREDLTAEAIRLARLLRELLPDEFEAGGLLALMLLTDSRRRARSLPDGMLVPLAEQDRRLWDRAQIAEGLELLSTVLGAGRPGPYQLQAAIAAVHAEAPSAAQTDWPQILALYTVLEAVAPSPVVTLNRAVAVAMAESPRAALELLDGLGTGLGDWHRLDAVRGHLLEMSGDPAGARECLLTAAKKTGSLQERQYLLVKVAKLGQLST
ncbi:sigma-70 family RNA polymerase sigma factor [Arthrobacter sp. YA7-1]|uniref:RNA polymerase sigma factor n=1 Tax=Arthrobacter sp. YA7-1 TaxID=2987701 RepID=UPI002225FF7A|nr:sigma-70 family RNA polymerase sigma factor [Arthrobacter sp. YA7-1]UYY81191.1 sigma-70 family RNA polymerase sigma factor [Arthrobacter sp. YA7-1]